MTLEQLADTLLELRRYVRSDPVHVRERLVKLRPTLYDESARLTFNLDFGLRCYIFNEAGEFIASTNLHVLEGHLYGAAAEIREHAERRRKEGGK